MDHSKEYGNENGNDLLQKALKEGLLVAHLQDIGKIHQKGPIESANRGEVLMRAKIDGEMVSPLKLLEGASDQQMQAVTREMVGQVLPQIKNLPEGYKVSFNLDTADFKECSILRLMEEMKKKFEFDPSQIVFEVTEKVCLENFVLEVSKLLKGEGFQVGLDDVEDRDESNIDSFVEALTNTIFDEIKIANWKNLPDASKEDINTLLRLSENVKQVVLERVRKTCWDGLEKGSLIQSFDYKKPIPLQEAIEDLL